MFRKTDFYTGGSEEDTAKKLVLDKFSKYGESARKEKARKKAENEKKDREMRERRRKEEEALNTQPKVCIGCFPEVISQKEVSQ